MTEEQIQRNRAFLVDLRANTLKSRGEFRDNEGGRCCLCVAYDSAIKQGFEPDNESEHDGDIPWPELAIFYGWEDPNPELKFQDGCRQASTLNDGYNCPEQTHCQIADLFEETFPELKTQET